MTRARMVVAVSLASGALLVSACGSSSGGAANPCTAPVTDYVFLTDRGAELAEAASEMDAVLEENRGAILAARGVKGVPAAEEAFSTYLAAIDTYTRDLNGHPFASMWGRSVGQTIKRLMPDLRSLVDGFIRGDVSLTDFAERGRALIKQGEGALGGFPATCMSTNANGETVVTIPR